MRVRGDADHPVSAGYTCSKGRGLPEWHHSDRRLDAPRLRGRDRELGRCPRRPRRRAQRHDRDARRRRGRALPRHGARVRRGRSGRCRHVAGFAAEPLVLLGRDRRQRAGARGRGSSSRATRCSTRSGIRPRPVCSCWSARTRSSPTATEPRCPIPVRHLREYRDRGGRVWVVDPRRTETAARADEHLAVRPGADVAAPRRGGGGAARRRRGSVRAVHARPISPSLRRALAPFTVDPGGGCGRSGSNGGRAAHREPCETTAGGSRSCAAPARRWRATGSSSNGCAGCSSSSPARSTGPAACASTGARSTGSRRLRRSLRAPIRRSLPADRPTAIDGWPEAVRAVQRQHPSDRVDGSWRGRRAGRSCRGWSGQLPAVALADEIEAGNVRSLVVTGGNPITAFPEPDRMRAALSQLDTLVVVDVVESELTALATHVLPATGQLERADLSLAELTAVRSGLQSTPAVVPAAGERRPVWWMLASLARHMGGDLLGGADPDDLDDELFLAGLLARSPLDADGGVRRGPARGRRPGGVRLGARRDAARRPLADRAARPARSAGRASRSGARVSCSRPGARWRGATRSRTPAMPTSRSCA